MPEKIRSSRLGHLPHPQSMKGARGLGLHLSPHPLAGAALVQVGSALGHWPQRQPLGLTGLSDLRLGHPEDGRAQLITQQLHENYKCRDSLWGHHFVPFSVEVLEAPIRRGAQRPG